eukprot:scpid14574/ scgid19188/ 
MTATRFVSISATIDYGDPFIGTAGTIGNIMQHLFLASFFVNIEPPHFYFIEPMLQKLPVINPACHYKKALVTAVKTGSFDCQCHQCFQPSRHGIRSTHIIVHEPSPASSRHQCKYYM